MEEQFKVTAYGSYKTFIFKMLITKYDGMSGVCEHIMMIRKTENTLKGINM